MTLLMAAVAASVITVYHEDLVPGQLVESAGLTVLVVPDREEVVGAAFGQVGDVRVLAWKASALMTTQVRPALSIWSSRGWN